jgi:hypothetical protein
VPKSCTICTSSQRSVIEKDMLTDSLREVARRHKTSKDIVHRHRKHMQITTTAAAEARGPEHGEEVLAQLKELNSRARALVAQAEAAGDARTALLGIRELKGLLELQAKLTGQLEIKSQHNSLHLHLSPERAAAIAQTYLMRHSMAEMSPAEPGEILGKPGVGEPDVIAGQLTAAQSDKDDAARFDSAIGEEPKE